MVVVAMDSGSECALGRRRGGLGGTCVRDNTLPFGFTMLQYGETCSMRGRDGKTKEIKEIAAANGGFLTALIAGENGIRSRDLADAVKRNDLVRVERGLYCTPDTWEDEYVVAQHRFARGVFSHDTALYLLELCDSAPESLTMCFPRGYNPSSAKRAGIVAKSSPEGLHDLGLAELTTPYGNAVRAYGAERTLCDMLRGKPGTLCSSRRSSTTGRRRRACRPS